MIFRRRILLALLMFASSAQADYQSGVITGYLTHRSGSTAILIVKVDSGTTAGCNTTGRLAMASTDARYNATFAAVVAAHSMQASVKVAYDTTCDNWSNSYDLSFVCVGDISR